MHAPSVFLVILFATPILADEPKLHKGLAYADKKNGQQTLDLYASPDGKNRPVVVWIHGGGWINGSKATVQKMPQVFSEKGYVFVSTTYRFHPQVTVKEMTGDIAKAIRWVHDHSKGYGGDPASIFVMGHSAGAHLAALVCTDDRYLKAEGLPLSVVKGCVPVDVSMYDIPKRFKEAKSLKPNLKEIFGETEESQRNYSPITYLAPGKNIPPFLILHVANRAESRDQSRWFANRLKESGVYAKVVAAEGTSHVSIRDNLSKPGDSQAEAIWDFMAAVSKKTANP